MLTQEPDVGVNYEYSLPLDVVPGTNNELYDWIFDEFTPCSATCGGGIQRRNVSCAGRKSLQPAERDLCNSNNEPASEQKCNEIPCEAQWMPYPWSNCSVPCGKGGVQTRQIVCQRIISGGLPSLVPDSECAHLPKPEEQQTCNEDAECAKWFIEPWKPVRNLYVYYELIINLSF